MAKKERDTNQEVERTQPAKLNAEGELKELNEATYSREEITAAASTFGVRPEVLAGALRMIDGDRLTRQQVQAAITKFRQKEV